MVGLAGVSRRSFYEQFANKQECFLATYDVIATRGAGRVSAAYRDGARRREERLQAAFGELGQAISDELEQRQPGDPRGAEGRRAGAAAPAPRVGDVRADAVGYFEHGSAPSPLPAPVIRGIAGGLHAAMSNCLREGSAGDGAGGWPQEMFRWTLLFQTPAAKQLAERLSERARAALVQGRKAPTVRAGGSRRARTRDERERLLEQALRLAVIEDYRELSAPQIADAADVSIDAFFELFDGKQECFLAALDMLGERADGARRPTRRCARSGLAAGRAPHDRRADALPGRAARSTHRRSPDGVFAAGPEAIERNVRLAHGIAARLTEGAPDAGRAACSSCRASRGRCRTPSAARWRAGRSSCCRCCRTTSPTSC